MIDTATPSPSPPETTPPTRVGSGEATAGTIIAGLVGAITTYAARKLHFPAEVITGILVSVGSGAMALWHQLKQ